MWFTAIENKTIDVAGQQHLINEMKDNKRKKREKKVETFYPLDYNPIKEVC